MNTILIEFLEFRSEIVFILSYSDVHKLWKCRNVILMTNYAI